MARTLRITFTGAFYHVTSRGNERKAVFKSKRDRQKFLQYLESATQRYDALIHAYCIGESGVSQCCRRVAQKIEKDKQLKKKIDRLKANKCVKNEDLTPMFFLDRAKIICPLVCNS